MVVAAVVLIAAGGYFIYWFRLRSAMHAEVRAIMAVFDETLYTAVPHVYRRVDDALQGPAAGSRSPVVRNRP